MNEGHQIFWFYILPAGLILVVLVAFVIWVFVQLAKPHDPEV